jgi:hypothetical protein
MPRCSGSRRRPDGHANLKLPTLASPHGGIDVRFICRRAASASE